MDGRALGDGKVPRSPLAEDGLCSLTQDAEAVLDTLGLLCQLGIPMPSMQLAL